MMWRVTISFLKPNSLNRAAKSKESAKFLAPSSIPGKICECISVPIGEKLNTGFFFFFSQSNTLTSLYIDDRHRLDSYLTLRFLTTPHFANTILRFLLSLLQPANLVPILIHF